MKKVFKYLGPIIIMVALLLTANHFLKPKTVVGKKEVTINIKTKLDGEETGIGYLEISSTNENDILTLGDILDIVNESDEDYNFILGGEKTDEYGRFLLGVNGMLADASQSQFWSIVSETNPDCIEAGFCNGIDLQPVLDKDIFDFILTTWQ